MKNMKIDESSKSIILKTIQEITNSLENDRNNHATEITSDIITYTIMNGSDMGVFIGEVLESSLIQHQQLFVVFDVGAEDKKSEISKIVPFINKIFSSIQSDNELKIYNSLVDLRVYVTQQQKDFGNKYKRRMWRPTTI